MEILKGTWWKPGEKELPGTLEYSTSKRPVLTVVGHFDAVDTLRTPIVHGVCQLGDITLFNNRYVLWETSSGHDSQGMTPEFILIGGHYDSPDQHFNLVQFSVFGLNEWTNVTGFKRTLTNPSIPYSAPQQIEFDIEGHCKASIQFALKWDFGNRYSTHHEQYPWITFDYEEVQPLKKVIQDITTFSQFVSFCLLQASYPIDIYVKKIAKHNPIRAHYIDDHPLYSTETKAREARYQLVPFKRVKDNLSKVLSNWFKLYTSTKTHPCLDLFIKVIRQRSKLNLEVFLDITKALEVFSRTVLDNVRTSQEFKDERKAIIDKMTPRQKQLFETILNNMKDITLKERILDLLQNYLESDPELKMLLADDYHTFAKNVTDTRNYHTHYDSKKRNVLEGDALKTATLASIAIMATSITKKLGIPKDTKREQSVIAVY